MTNEMSPAQRAARIADMVVQLAKERADNEHPNDWTQQRSFDDYVTTIRSVEAWTEGPRHARVVVACPRMHPHLGHWTNVASELIDAASDRVDTAAGVDPNVEHWQIVQPDGDYEARLVPLVEHEPYGCGDCGADPDQDCTDPEGRQCEGAWTGECSECGAAPGEQCRLPGCQGEWPSN